MCWDKRKLHVIPEPKGTTLQRLEANSSAKLQGTGGIEAGDIAKRATANSQIGIRQLRMVEEVESFYSNLELTLAIQIEAAEGTGVDPGRARPPELVTMRIAKVRRNDLRRGLGCRVRGLHRISKGRGIEPWTSA